MKASIAHVLTGFYLAFALSLWAPLAHAGHDDEYIETVPVERVKAMLDQGEQLVFIDLRSPNGLR